MIHQVNLYKPEFRPKRILLSLDRLAVAAVVLLMLSSGISLIIGHVESRFTARLAVAQATSSHLDQEISRTADVLESRTQDPALVRRVESMQQQLAQGARLVALLRSERMNPVEQRRYSEVMHAFARQAKGGLWLEEIAINEDGFRFDGYVDSPSRMPSYLEGLGREPVFGGHRFNGLQISNVNGTPNLSFSLRSESQPGGDADQIAMEAAP